MNEIAKRLRAGTFADTAESQTEAADLIDSLLEEIHLLKGRIHESEIRKDYLENVYEKNRIRVDELEKQFSSANLAHTEIRSELLGVTSLLDEKDRAYRGTVERLERVRFALRVAADLLAVEEAAIRVCGGNLFRARTAAMVALSEMG